MWIIYDNKILRCDAYSIESIGIFTLHSQQVQSNKQYRWGTGSRRTEQEMQTRKIKPIIATLFPCAHTLARAPLSGPAWQCPQP